ncbi:MAG: lamin tail domain-containing protein [candidate division WOR-3 bacterium]|nr:lamin tail domain-containing protein [candidate division WOR-3 bacterium]MCX7756967.1 lamin tail domain-containing protein [candidate division WOR-3 bacterium]MDW7987549.1 lamin tail domain-containing protein [candidate division WOR-3 bacterium]
MSIIYLSLLIFNLTSRLVINEVMANPRGITGSTYPEDRNEYVELYNISSDTIDVRNWRITDFDATDSIVAWVDSTIFNYYANVKINTTKIPPFSYALILDREYLSAATGGYFAPYRLPDSLVILTVGNTTIGNELQTTDPLLLYSQEGDSSSFGTPFENDSFPYDLGDGLSWERISMELEDYPVNWHASLDSCGGTPGQQNSTYNFYDLGIISIDAPRQVLVNSPVKIFITVKNFGYRPAYNWQVFFFNDKNRNQRIDSGEQFSEQFGMGLNVNSETTLESFWSAPRQGDYCIAGLINYSEDRRLENNYSQVAISAQSFREVVWVFKNSFTPDNDLIDDSLFIYYEFENPQGRLLCLVYDLNGQLVRRLKDGPITERAGVISWDGKSERNQLQPIGLYIIYVEYKTPKEKIVKKIPIALIRRL